VQDRGDTLHRFPYHPGIAGMVAEPPSQTMQGRLPAHAQTGARVRLPGSDRCSLGRVPPLLLAGPRSGHVNGHGWYRFELTCAW
jgi:hypothetical protein